MHTPEARRVNENFIETMKSFSLPGEPFSILLGFSGGADSSALFSLLHANSVRFGYTLYAVHVNHMIRGEEADRDENFCRECCAECGVKFFVHKADVPTLAHIGKRGLEETARDVRYSAFDELSKKIAAETGGTVLIATAHNADDNAETVLFNLVRGSALSGLCGIAPRRGNIIRPLILSTKDEILVYCEENGIKYITDSTNTDTAYTRNKLRHNVMPILREINPSLSRAISRTAALLTADDDYMNRFAENFVKQNMKDGKLPLSSLEPLHPAIKSRVLYCILKSKGVKNCADTHVDAVSKLCEKAVPHSKADLPGKITAVIENGALTFSYTMSSENKDTLDYLIPLPFGITEIHQTGAVFARFDSNDKENIEKFKNIYKIFIQTLITSDKIKGALHLRSRKAGDVCNINGVNRKLKKLLWELEAEPAERDLLPLLCDEGGVLWVPGARSRTGTYPTQGEASQTFFYVKSAKQTRN